MKTIFTILVSAPFISFSQLIKSNQVDPFSHEKRIVTQDVQVGPGFDLKRETVDEIAYNTIDNKIFIVLWGDSRTSGLILQDDIAVLVTEKDTISVKFAGFRRSSIYTLDGYVIKKEDVAKLSKSKLLAIRRYTSTSVFELPIKERFQGNLMKLSKALLEEMNK